MIFFYDTSPFVFMPYIVINILTRSMPMTTMLHYYKSGALSR